MPDRNITSNSNGDLNEMVIDPTTPTVPHSALKYFSQLTICIEYQIIKPVTGCRFFSHLVRMIIYLLTLNQGYRYAVMDGPLARCWMPCIDVPQQRCTWDIDVRVQSQVPSLEEEDAMRDILVVASGDIIRQVRCPVLLYLPLQTVCPMDSSRKIVSFSLNTPACVSDIHVAVGPFAHVPSLPLPNSLCDMDHFVPPRLLPFIRPTTDFLNQVHNCRIHSSADC
jgi:hypothetical protein